MEYKGILSFIPKKWEVKPGFSVGGNPILRPSREGSQALCLPKTEGGREGRVRKAWPLSQVTLEVQLHTFYSLCLPGVFKFLLTSALGTNPRCSGLPRHKLLLAQDTCFRLFT